MKVKSLLKFALLVGLIGLTMIMSRYQKIEFTGRAVYENGKIQAYFCPEDDCKGKMATELNKAQQSIHCAIYNINEAKITEALQNKNIEVKLVMDRSEIRPIKGVETVRNYDTGQLMHNKFCIIDGKEIITGSYNPTMSEANNTNNILIISSKYLAQNYEDEFQELWGKQFGQGKQVNNPKVYLNSKRVENYFCPEDDCSKKVIRELEGANQSITFYTFSFTDKDVAQGIIKKYKEGKKVQGLMEDTQKSQYSQYQTLKDSGIEVKWYGKKYKLHDKVFIIDESIVITGSYNPTENGDNNNDENILIIEDKEIAKKYTERFKTLSS
jgi:phosphatidylserine/phosphatidylglycerophosphate/cardiolipin synthase-like enzyme